MTGKSPKSEWYPMMGMVRYVLALLVLYCHVIYLCGYDLPSFNLSFYSVGGFFSLSGFLMYPNLTRHNDTLRYLRQRARRILPAYFFIVIVCALLLVAVSSLSFGRYFTDSRFYKYLFWNLAFLNWLQPSLPGVFDTQQYVTTAVNGSLWTMKVEWCLYLSLPVFIMFCHRFRARYAVTAVWVILFSVLYRIAASLLYESTGSEIYNILGRQIFGMLAFFYSGVILYFLRRRIEKVPLLWAACGIILILAATTNRYMGHILHPVGISLLVVALSLTAKDSHFRGARHNVSYEIYLFHFPVIQLLLPYFTGLSPFTGILISAAATTALAVIYHYIEVHFIKPANKWRIPSR